jgi:hypothetical protein
MYAVRRSDHAGYGTGGTGATAFENDGDQLISGQNAGGRAWARRYRLINQVGPVSGNGNIAGLSNIAIASFGSFFFDGTLNPGGKIRCLVGMNEASGGPSGEADALAGAGFGWEIYWSVANNRTEIRAVAHNRTTYSVSAGAAFPTLIQTLAHVIVELTTAGVVNVYGISAAATYMQRPSFTPIASTTGGPISGPFFAGGYVNWQAANHSTIAPTSANSVIVKVTDRVLRLY